MFFCSQRLHLLPEFAHPVGRLRTRNGDLRRDLRPEVSQLHLTFNLNSPISLLLFSESLLMTEDFFRLCVPGAILPEANLFLVPLPCPTSPLTSSLVWLSLIVSVRDCQRRFLCQSTPGHLLLSLPAPTYAGMGGTITLLTCKHELPYRSSMV